jgi:hypothetical protein
MVFFRLFNRRACPPSLSVTAERRRVPRQSCVLNAFCRRLGAAVIARSHAVACDLSAGGINLFLSQPYEPNTLLMLELDSAGRRLSRLLLVRVKHIVERAPGEWLMGCAFESRLSDAEVQALLPEGTASTTLRDDVRWQPNSY